MRGEDVKAVQELLIKRHLLPTRTADGVAGPATLHAFVAAKRLYRYPKDEQTPTCGDRLVASLETGKSPFHHLPIPHPHANEALHKEHQTRALMAEIMDEGVHNEPRIHYGQVRPYPHITREHWRTSEVTTDCSGSSTIICMLAGVPKDPNGSHYNGYGYTGTIMAHARPITRAELKIGDLIVFGPYPGHHIVMVRKLGSDPLVFSHGQEKGPFFIRLSEEQKFQSKVLHYYSVF